MQEKNILSYKNIINFQERKGLVLAEHRTEGSDLWKSLSSKVEIRKPGENGD